MYFLHPTFILISGYGLSKLIEGRDEGSTRYLSWQWLLSYTFIFLSYWMIRNHPFQNCYFNSLLSKTIKLDKKFEIDHWGLAYKQAYEYIMALEPEGAIDIGYPNTPGKVNYMALHPSQRNRIKNHDNYDAPWKYFITNYRWGGAPQNGEKIHSIKVDGHEILGIFKRKCN
jgi:hypothetical protein